MLSRLSAAENKQRASFVPRIISSHLSSYFDITTWRSDLVACPIAQWNPQGTDFRQILRQSHDNLRIFVQYTLILRQIYDITYLRHLFIEKSSASM